MRKQIKMSKFDFNHSMYPTQTSVYNILSKPETTYKKKIPSLIFVMVKDISILSSVEI
jgi:hypothetical protein